MSLTEARPGESPDSGLGITLPAGSGARSIQRRRRRQERRQRRLFGTALLTAALGAAVLVGADQVGQHIARNEKAAVSPAPPPASPKVLLAHRHPDGTARWVTILSEGEQAGSIVMLPAGTMAEVPSLGLEPLGKALEIGGPTRLGSTVENLLGVDISSVAVLDDADLVALAAPVAPLEVQVPARVEEVLPDGEVQILYEPGLHRLVAEEVPAYLSSKGVDNDLAMLARHQGFWESLLAELAEPGAPTLGGSEDVAEILGRLAVDGDVRARLLPVEPVGNTDTAGTDALPTELYQVEPKALKDFLASAFPGAQGLAARPTAQVLNGTGGVEVTAHAAEKLVPGGIQVALTGNAPRFDYKVTQIVFYDEDEQALAEKARRALGVGRLVLSRRPLGVVDLTIIIGADFSGGSAAEEPAATPRRRT